MKEDSLVVTEYMKDLFLYGPDRIAYLVTYRCDLVLSQHLEKFLVMYVN